MLREWGRIGCIGVGGPPTHIRLMRDLCVEREGWIEPIEFEDAVAACNLLPGPASTQLSIFCAWRVRGWVGAIVGGLAFIIPGLISILVLAVFFLAKNPPHWISGAAAGAGAVVAAVAVQAGVGLLPSSWQRASQSDRAFRRRWLMYFSAALIFSAFIGYWLVLLLLACGVIEVASRTKYRPNTPLAILPLPFLFTGVVTSGVLTSVAWIAFKVGALSYGGGFVIIPLIQSDVVNRYHWMTGGQFLNAVALGQITPGPVAHTVVAVGYAAAGMIGALVAVLVTFTPSFAFIIFGAGRFRQLRKNFRVRAFLDGAGSATIGAILGSAIPLARALSEPWQFIVLASGAVLMMRFKRGVVITLLAGAGVGIVIAAFGGAIPK
ncbi:MAG: chromate efflux transporter [Candidatus Nanopelagicaceae bacterium]|nr:chromate efflux transporter [Candidatus Nanopelagicaceae bacterium]